MIDCHAHLAATEFDADRDAVRARARREGVEAVLVVGEDRADNERVLEVCAAGGEGSALYPCLGLHPDRWAEDRDPPDRAALDAVLAQIRENAHRIAAIGEVGLDRWWVKSEERRKQQEEALAEIAALALELDLPLNVHSRSAGRRTLDLLREVGVRKVLMHAYDGKAGHARDAAEDRGFVFSIPPSARRSRQKQKLVRLLPLERLALETDSPVLGPEKGVRNEPGNLTVSRDVIAEIQGRDPDEVAEVTRVTALGLFPRLRSGGGGDG